MAVKTKSTSTIRQTARIGARPVEVYDALVNPSKHAAFTGAKATGKPLVGGRFTAWDGYISGKYLELAAGKRIVAEWRTTEWPGDAAPSLLTLSFRRIDSGTELTMLQSRVPASQAAQYRDGWKAYYWQPLRDWFSKKYAHKPGA